MNFCGFINFVFYIYNIYFENAHLENILKFKNIFLEVDIPLACMTYFRWKRGNGDLDYSGLDTVSGPLFDYNIYFENAHLENILKNHKYIPRSRPSTRLYDIFQVEKGERERRTTVV